MNRVVIIILGILFMSMLCGCEKTDEPEQPNKKYYYVKYEGRVSSIYSTNSIKYYVNTGNGIKIFTQGKSFSQIFGPFEKGFEASITVDAMFMSRAECEAYIYVSERDEPFALKVNKKGGDKIKADYVIK